MNAARALAGWAGADAGCAVLLVSPDASLRDGLAEVTGLRPVVACPGDVGAIPPASVDVTWLDLLAPVDAPSALAECARVTRPGGSVVVRVLDTAGRTPDEAAAGLADALALLGLDEVASRVTLTESAADTAGDAALVARTVTRGVPRARLLEVAVAAVARGTVRG